MIKQAPTEDGVPSVGNMDPTAMMGGMKGNMIMMIIQIVLMTWINSMFDGFVVLKMPFPLSYRFKLITQQGLGGIDLDVSYVSSISWYLLVFAGGRYIIRLFDINNEVIDMGAMTGMPTSYNGMSIGGTVGAFNKAAENISLLDHGDDCFLDTIEDTVIEDFGGMKKSDQKDVKRPKKD